MKRPKKSTARESGETASQSFMRIARTRFKAELTRSDKQRQREDEDIRFYNGDQWPSDVQASRAGQEANNGMPPIPARPCLVINKQREPVRQVLNMERNADLGFELVPADDFGAVGASVDDSEIELREGFVRRVQRESQAAAARTWAFERGVIAGEGYYGVSTRYGYGATADQEIFIEKFWDQSAVLLGMSFEPDGSDAEFAFVGVPMPYDQYCEEFPYAEDGTTANANLDLGDGDFGAFAKNYPDWFISNDDGTKLVRVVRYYYFERESREVAMFEDGRAMWLDELPAGVEKKSKDNPNGYTTRRVVEKRVKMAKIDGTQILEQTDWPGRYIPIVKFTGEQLQPVDGDMRAEGMVRPGRDAQRGSNYMISKGVEMVGLTPIPPLILDPESISGYEPWYYSANTRTLPFLPQRTRGDDGREYREAHRPNVDPNIQPVAAFIQLFNESIQSTMGVHDPSNGKVDPALRSGKAIDRIVSQDQHGTSNFLDNLGRSIHYEATIVNDLLYPIYGRPGRIAKILNKQNQPESVMLHQPFTMNGSRPVAAPSGTQGAKTMTLTADARFNVAIKITKNSELKRDQVAEFLGGLVSADPAQMGIYGDLLFDNLDVPGHKEFAERAKVMLAPPVQQLLESRKQGQEIPPQIRQQMAQGQQIIEHLTKTVQQLEQQQQADSVKQQAENQRAQKKADTDIELKRMELAAKADDAEKERATKVLIARIQAGAKGTPANPEAAAQEERIAIASEQQHEMQMAAADAGHEQMMAAADHDRAMELAAANAQHAQAAAVTDAALQPPPETASA